MNGLRAVVSLRFREALAGRMLWLLPLHFAVAFAVVRSLPGPSLDARLQAADATALGLAAVLALVAAAVMGASPLAAERLRSRGTLVLAAPVSPATRVLGTAFGTGGALLLLVLGLCASAMAAVDLGVGGNSRPHGWIRADSLAGGIPDPREVGLLWLTKEAPSVRIEFEDHLLTGGGDYYQVDRPLEIEARVRVSPSGEMPGVKRIALVSDDAAHTRKVLAVPLAGAFRTRLLPYQVFLTVERVPGNFDLGLRREGLRYDAGPRPRALARFLHAVPLAAGLLATMGAAMALSTVTGGGVAAGGALALAFLALFRTLFADAASTLAHAGAMEKAIEAAQGGHVDAVAMTGTPPALAPVFQAMASALPEGTRFDLSAAVAANEVPDPSDATRAVVLGLALMAVFLVIATLGARRRP